MLTFGVVFTKWLLVLVFRTTPPSTT